MQISELNNPMSLLYLMIMIRNRIRIVFRLIFILMGLPLLVEGQIDLQVMDIPQKFVIPTDESDLKDDMVYFEGNPWIVYSDREYNKSYTQPGGSVVMKDLDKFSAYQVVGWKKEYLHIGKKIKTGNEATSALEDFGWVEMSKLLLWNHCLVKPENYCNKKAIVIYSDHTSYLFEKIGHPEDAGLGFTVFFIYKSFGDNYLVGTSPKLPKTLDNVSGIIDWIPRDFVWEWSEIEALEPNCKFRRQLPGGTEISTSVIFNSEASLKRFNKSGTFRDKDIYWRSDTCEERMPAGWLRFPVLTEEDSTIIVGLFPGYLRITTEEEVSILQGYCNIDGDPSNPMFSRVILASKEELGKIVNIYNMFLDKVGPSSSFRDVAEAWTAVLKEERYDQRGQDHSLITFKDINRMLFSFNHSNEIPGSIPIGIFAGITSYINFDYQTYYTHLSENLNRLKIILNQKNNGDGFYANGAQYYWLPASLLP